MFKSFILAALASFAMAAGDGPAYNYHQHGADWGSIEADDGSFPYAMCSEGKRQSPVNLSDAIANGSMNADIQTSLYEDMSNANVFKVIKNGQVKTVEVALANGQLDRTDDMDVTLNFTPTQFHFHSPSEHTINGELYDLEMHIVHKYKDTEDDFGGVLGIMFDSKRGGEGESLFLEQIKPIFTSATDEVADLSVSLRGFLDSLNTEDFWIYNGSLTTPPCTEGIKWTVLKDVQPISPEQVAGFMDLWKETVPAVVCAAEGEADYDADCVEADAYEVGNNREVQNFQSRPMFYSNYTINEEKVLTVVFGVLFGAVTAVLIAIVWILCACPRHMRLQKKTAA